MGLRSPDRAWKVLAVLLMLALASEVFDKDPYLVRGGVAIPFARFMAVLSLILAMLLVSLLRRRAGLGLPSLLKPLFFFWLAGQLSILGILWMNAGQREALQLISTTGDPVFRTVESSTIIQFLRTDAHFTIYILFVYAILKLADWDRVRFLFRAYYVFGILAAIFAVMQFMHGSFGWLPWMSPYLLTSSFYRDIGFRASSIFGEPSWAARYYVHWIALSMAFFSISHKTRYLLFLGLFGLAFYMAASLAGYAILLTFVLILAFVRVRSGSHLVPVRARKWVFLGSCLLVCFLLISSLFEWSIPMLDVPGKLLDRFGVALAGRGGMEVRAESSLAGLKVWGLSPLFGVGLGNARFHMPQFFSDAQTLVRSYQNADTVYSQVLAELGVIGFIAFLYFLVKMALPSRQKAEVAGQPADMRQAKILLTFLQIDLLAQVVGMANYGDYLSPPFWLFVSMILVLQQFVSRRGRSYPGRPGNTQIDNPRMDHE